MSGEKTCALCGLDIGLTPYVLNAANQKYLFCCEGCRGIYEMLHDIKPAEEQNNPDQPS